MKRPPLLLVFHHDEDEIKVVGGRKLRYHFGDSGAALSRKLKLQGDGEVRFVALHFEDCVGHLVARLARGLNPVLSGQLHAENMFRREETDEGATFEESLKVLEQIIMAEVAFIDLARGMVAVGLGTFFLQISEAFFCEPVDFLSSQSSGKVSTSPFASKMRSLLLWV